MTSLLISAIIGPESAQSPYWPLATGMSYTPATSTTANAIVPPVTRAQRGRTPAPGALAALATLLSRASSPGSSASRKPPITQANHAP